MAEDLPDWMGGSSSTTTEEPAPTPAPSPEKDLPDWLQGDNSDRLNASLKASGKIQPDHAAKVLRVKDQTGLPSNFVSRNLADLEAKQNATVASSTDIQKQAPKVADWLAEDPHHAAVAGSDIPLLNFLERQFSYQGNQLERGWFDIERSALGAKAFVGLGNQDDEKRISAIEKKLGTDLNQKAPGPISNIFGKVVEGVPQLAGVIGAGAATAAVGVPATATAAAAFGAMEAGNAYLDYRGRKDEQGNPLSDHEARGWATVSGVLNGAAALVPMGKLMEQVPGLRMLSKEGIDSILTSPSARGAFQTYIKNIGESSLTMGGFSGFGTLVHNAAGKLAELQNDKNLSTYSPMQILSSIFTKDTMKEMAASAGTGAATGALFSGGAGSMRFFNDYRNAIKTQESWRNIGEAVKSAQMSKTAPEQLEKVISRIAPDQNVFIPMEKWQSYWESKKVDPRTAFKEAVGNTSAYDESIRAGTDLQIPAAKYATTIAPSEHNEAFLDSLRSRPDVLNVEEAKLGESFHAEQEKVNEANKKPGLLKRGVDFVKGLLGAGKEEEKPTKPMTSDEFIKNLPPEHQAAVEAGRKSLIGGTSTREAFADEKGAYTPERHALHEEIVKSFEKPEAVAPEGTKPKATIVIGPPGSGKSFAIRKMGGNFVEIDNDAIKAKLPGFEPAKAALYHEESSDVERMVTKNVMKKNMNMVISSVGKTADKFTNMVKSLKDFGYDVDLVHFKMKPEDAAKSAIERFMRGGRYVDPQYVIDDVGLKTEETYGKLKSEVRNYEQYQASPSKGQEPQLLERNGENGGLPRGSNTSGNAGSTGREAESGKEQTSVDLPPKDESRLKFTKDLAQKSLLAARMEQGTTPLFDDPKAVGMKPEQEARYLKARLEAEESAAKQMADKIRGEQDRIQNADRKNLRAEIEPQVNAQKEYVALDVLSGKKEAAEKLGIEPFKLDRTGVNEVSPVVDNKIPTERAKSLPRGITVESGGIHPDQAAEILGYRSGSELIFNLETAPDREQVINDRIEERLQEKYGNPLDQEHLRNEAFKSIHNEDRSRLLQLELQHLASNDFAAFKGMVKAITRDVPRLAEVKSQASDMIGSKMAGETLPYLYQRAESLAGHEARDLFLKGDIPKAFEAKSRELLNHELFRAAQDAREQTEKDISFASKFDRDSVRAKLGKAGSDYLEQIDALREKFDFAPVSGKEIGRRQSLRDFVDAQRKAGYEPAIPPEVLNEAYRKSYREMTNDELHGIVDAMRNIDHLAGLKTKLLASQAGREYDEVKGDVISSLTKTFDIKPEDLDKPIDLHPSLMDKVGKSVANFAAWQTKMEYLFRFMDGGAYHGPAWETFFKPLNDAEDFKTAHLRDAFNTVNDIFNSYSKSERTALNSKLFYVPELEGSTIKANLTKMEMMMSALHWGNEGNRTELMRGYKWSEDQVRSIWKNLDARDFETVKKIWDHINSYWPEIAKQERELSGLIPKKIEASPFDVVLKDGSTVHLDGGYFPLVYDRNISSRAANFKEIEDLKDLMPTQAGRAATKNGWTNERVGGGGMAPSLNIGTYVNHVSDVIHDLAYRKPVIDTYKLINDDEIKNNIEASVGKGLYQQLNPWLKRIAGDRPWNPLGPIGDLLTKVRANATTAELAFKFTSAAIHSTSFSSAAREVGVGYAMDGLKQFYSDPRGSWKFITDRSEFMRARPENMDRDLRSRISSGKNLFDSPGLEAASWSLMRGFDIGVAGPTWMAAFKKAMEGGVRNIDAGDQPGAVDYADQLVRDTKGSGAAKDLAPIETAGGSLGKLFTMFYRQQNVIANQFMEAYREYRIDKDPVKLMTTYAMVGFLPAVLTELIRGRGPGEDENWGKWLGKSTAFFTMGTVPGLRDVVSGWQRGGIQPSPAFEALNTIFGATKAAITKEEWTQKDYENALMSVGFMTGLPTRQALKTAQYFHGWMTGEEQPSNAAEGAYRLLVGRKPRE